MSYVIVQTFWTTRQMPANDRYIVYLYDYMKCNIIVTLYYEMDCVYKLYNINIKYIIFSTLFAQYKLLHDINKMTHGYCSCHDILC